MTQSNTNITITSQPIILIMYSYYRKKLGNLRSGEPNPGLYNAHSPYHNVPPC